ncbi:MAG: phosphonate ABC transporter, permease protein PhnE [Nitrosopumilus sp.]|nr:phosphonate ABC transporter, permease protein PhnE [Nitrosopumilus sp.]CAI9831312.1 Phosphonate ABC transporter, inner membrane subunit [Nitrosopumilaceae archaeon]MDA7944311.1 phosphonate ABC transporter, permease protein PhnE [Nitrosopumilus sp.]MDA7952409.1 phosphonate ABC transporter, permease protein PhnE [Nitrosopumilus sp.]MDA7954063.1 phosphonate ABC transporter, permease protein PhnE [Nitrosopumilus sp.]
MTPSGNLVAGIIVALVVAASVNLGANPGLFIGGLPNLWIVAEEMIQVDPGLVPDALLAMAETIQMAFVGTMVGVAIALPMSLLAARNIAPAYVHAPVRALLAAVRTFPSILWAILFVIMVGIGPFAGILAIIMYTVGFVAKLQYEVIEAIDPEPMDAVLAIGASRLQLVRHVVIPESASHLLGQLLYMLDYNIRQTSILGLVGAGGIGFYVITYLQFFEYGKAAVFMLVVLASVLAIDWASTRIRDRYIVRPYSGP